MPANKFASHYLNGAYQRMLAAIQDMEPPAFSLFPTSDQFENAAEHLQAPWVSAIDDYLRAVVIEANSNARSNISAEDRICILSNAIHDSGLLGDLRAEAYALQEEAA